MAKKFWIRVEWFPNSDFGTLLQCLIRKKFCFKFCSGNTDTTRLTVLKSLKWDIAQWKEDSSSWSTPICFHTCLSNVSFMVLFTITYIDFGLYCLVHADVVLIKDNIQSDSVLVFAKAIFKKNNFYSHSPSKRGKKPPSLFF